MRTHDVRWRTKFASFVGEVTVGSLIEGLQREGIVTTQKAVYHWIAGRTVPRLPTAVALVRVSAGRLTLEDIAQHRQEAAHGAGRKDRVAR